MTNRITVAMEALRDAVKPLEVMLSCADGLRDSSAATASWITHAHAVTLGQFREIVRASEALATLQHTEAGGGEVGHRLSHIQKEPKDWRSFFAAAHDDAPIAHIIELAKRLWATTPIVFVSGRSDECRDATERWLERFGFPIVNQPHYRSLYMRKAGDHRPDHIVKAELLDRIIADGFRPIMAFDDRDQVVKMWRAKGIPCAQVAEGNF